MHRSLIMCITVLIGSFCPAVTATEIPVEVSDAQITEIVAAAPEVPVDLGLDLNMRLVDFIDCTDPDDPHPMIDQGTSSVVDGPAGRYRVTSQGRHSFFAYRWRAAAQDKPHVLVIEYPDDAQRSICFFTHESKLTGRANLDWSLETGVYTGNPYPLTGTMQYHTMFFWPYDDWPVIIVANWIRAGAPAAASRIWVFRVDGDLPAAEVVDPDPTNPRIIGDLYNWAKVPVEGCFGLTSKASTFDNIAQYYAYLGCNVVAWPVVSNNTWGFRCLIPAWDGGNNPDQDWLTGILEACERRGVKFIGSFDMGRRFTMGGLRPTEENREAYREALLKGFVQFLQRYGDSPALHGIAFGTPDFGPPYGNATLDILMELFDGDLSEFTKFIHAHKPDLKIYTFVGARNLHSEYFADFPGVMARWEKSGGKWEQFLADEVLTLWRQWGRDPHELTKVPGLTVVHQYQPDDHAIYDSYAQQPRAMGYLDVDRSAPKSANMDTRSVMLWNTFFEGWFGLHPDVNFWYQKLWVAPDFNHSQPYASAAWARAMEHRDRDVVIAGAWNRKAGGHEATYRRFAQAYRSLPPTELDEMIEVDGGAVQVRRGVYKGATYVSVLNTTPFDQAALITLGDQFKPVALRPFELAALRADGDMPVAADATVSHRYVQWLQDRLDTYERLLAEVKAIEPAAVPPVYAAHAERARRLLEQGRYREMDLALGFGLTGELELRKRILQPPQFDVGRVDAPATAVDLDAWPDEALDIHAHTGEYLAAHLYFPNSWTGPEDLSARVRMAHDGERLYIGMRVLDDILTDEDVLTLFFSPANYRKWLVESPAQAQYEITYSITVPVEQPQTTTTGRYGFQATARRIEGGYTVTASFDVAALDLTDNRLGFSIHLGDHDGSPGAARHAWAKETIMVIPHAPTFTYWSDARTCGELVLKE